MKTGRPARVSWVRIPPHPPLSSMREGMHHAYSCRDHRHHRGARCCANTCARGHGVRARRRLVDVDNGRVLPTSWCASRTAASRGRSPGRRPPRAAATVIDWSRYTVLPGLMDMHTHLADEGQSADPARAAEEHPARDAFIGAKNARETLRAGFTTVRDVGTYRGFADVALRDAINAGLVPGPRMFVAGAYITVPGGGGEVTGLPQGMMVPDEFRRGVADNEAEVRQSVRRPVRRRRRFHQGDRHRRRAHRRHRAGRVRIHRGRNPRRGRGSRARTAPSSPRMRTVPKASRTRCAPACARSSTAR